MYIKNKTPKNKINADKLVLISLPFNDPQIPPLGLSLIKGYMSDHNYKVKIIDANIEIQFRKIQDSYFSIIEKYIPANRMGNYYSVRLDIIQNHMMGYLYYSNQLEQGVLRNCETTIELEEEYIDLVRVIIAKNFYFDISENDIKNLNKIVVNYFKKLRTYIEKLIQLEEPTLFGISVNSVTLPSSLFSFKLAKEINTSIKTVIGGGIFADELSINSINLDYFVNKTPYIDKIIMGAGESLLLQYLRGELDEERKIFTIDDINQSNCEREKFSRQDLSDFNLVFYSYVPAYASFGCPFNCSFCTIPMQWGKYRKKEPKQTATELIDLYKKHGFQLVYIVDSLLNPIIDELCYELRKYETPIYWDASLRVSQEVKKYDNALLWRKSGFYRARIGVETGSQRLLDLMNKKTSLAQIKESLASLANAGIKTTTFWVIGYPGETEDDFLKTLEFVEDIKDDLYETTFRPYLYYKSVDGANDNHSGVFGSYRLYPEDFKEKLIIEQWVPDNEPNRDIIYDRVNRFHQHIINLGIPNPYTLAELDLADKRWLALHENAVPPLIKFRDKSSTLDECRKIEQVFRIKEKINDNIEFNFL